jgi:hypothetical protein
LWFLCELCALSERSERAVRLDRNQKAFTTEDTEEHGLMISQKNRFTAENAEGAEATCLLKKVFSATSATSAVKMIFSHQRRN